MSADSQTNERDPEKSRTGAVLWGQEILPVIYSNFVHEPQHLCPPWKKGTFYRCCVLVEESLNILQNCMHTHTISSHEQEMLPNTAQSREAC